MKKILIANRGEIARRIMQSAKILGINTVAVYSSYDRHLPFVLEADESYELLGTSVKETYLNIEQIIYIAKKSNSDAIHPGYGFLSENSEFAKALATTGITFIGPSAISMEAVGSKIEAKQLAQKVKVPTVPGISKNVSEKEIKEFCKANGYPVLLKASGGGGGRGMKVVTQEIEIKEQLLLAKNEAKKFFGSDEVFLEKFVENPKHIEVQAVGDNFGNVSILGLRDCSMQRNNQKVIEEAPAQSISKEIKDKLFQYASKLLKEVKYQNAATVEFLVKNEEVYFLEVNSRLQVEHPVTEAITGIDLVRTQIKIAQGEALSNILPTSIIETGHAIELRICAEDEKFISSTGRILEFSFPHDIRLDAGFSQNNFVTSEYDSMIAKIIVHADTRESAITKAKQALKDSKIFGIKTNIPFLFSLLSQQSFSDNTHHIKTVSLIPFEINKDFKSLALTAFFLSQIDNDFSCIRSFSVDDDLVEVSMRRIGEDLFINNMPYSFEKVSKHHIRINQHNIFIKNLSSERSLCLIDGVHYELSSPTYTFESTTGGDVISPLPGKIISLSVKNGDAVKKGETILFIESMKMEHPIKAPQDGIIHDLSVNSGDAVQNRSILCRVLAL